MSNFYGIDVSKHNGTVNWTKVKAAGKSFVIVRLGWAGYDGRIEANGGLDPLFHSNVEGALAAGLDVGVYVYSYCKTIQAAAIAARETLELVKSYRLAYPVAFDIEDGIYLTMSKADNTAIADSFLTAVEQGGYFSQLYTYKNFAEHYLDMSRLARFNVWIAQYAAKCTYSGPYGMWQYAGDEGRCSGVTGPCDLNIAYMNYAKIIEDAGLNGFGNGETPPEESCQQLLEDYKVLEADYAQLALLYDKALEENKQMRRDIAALAQRWPTE